MVRYVPRRNTGRGFREPGRMYPPAQGQPRTKRRFPNWLKIALATFGVLFLLGAIFGKSPQPKTAAAPPPPPAATTAATSTTPTPAAETYTVASVTDGATLEVVAGDGARKTVHVLGVTTTGTSSDCFGAQSLTWATTKLAGTLVRLGVENAGAVTVTLADGLDYATVAVQDGYLKSATAALAAAEAAARQAAHGFWGPPCNGSVTLAVPTPPPAPTSAPPAAATKAAPKPPPVRTTAEAPPAEPDNSSAYYANCSAAKAAHAAPLYAGQPGYRSGLDRDHDGVACET
jgi:micrococcal nuclease